MFFTFPKDFRARKPLPGLAQYLVWGDKVMLPLSPTSQCHCTITPTSNY